MLQYSDFTEYIVTFINDKFAQAFGTSLISFANPIAYNPNEPLRLWAVQVVIILLCTQLLSLILGRIRQPRVIAEVLSGVILGPSVMGRIPYFSSTIFPSQSIPLLSLTANLGLVFFLFLVGLEIDTRVVRKNAKISLTISLAGFLLPCTIGALLAAPIYNRFIDQGVNFVFFQLFIATAVGITAFPVLCRILTELRLLDTTVGIVVLSAGVGNDVVGWILLALTVALVNAGSALAALWVLATCTAYTLFLLFPVRNCFVSLARVTGSLENGSPTATMVTATLLLVIMSAVFTDMIGVHCIFGGFLAGLIIPHEGGFAIALVEKLEDFVSIVFLPIYFTLSGLKTDLATLDNGVIWAFTVLICFVAFFGKFTGSFFTARFLGFTVREAGAIGSLMSCKGLVELIVLNVGLEAKILNTRVFSMFVVEALLLTFITTPLTLLWYPLKYRTPMGALYPIEDSASFMDSESSEEFCKTKLAVVLTKLEHLPALMTVTEMIQGQARTEGLERQESSSTLLDDNLSTSPSVTLNVLRLVELTERTSAVLRSQEVDTLVHRDPAASIFRTFGSLHQIPVSVLLSVANHEDFPLTVATHIRQTNSQLVIIPWDLASLNLDLPIEDHASGISPPPAFEGLFANNETSHSVVYPHFIRKVFARSPADVALYVDCGHAISNGAVGNHIFMPFFGGPDDRAALSFVLQLCLKTSNTATVIRFTKSRPNNTGIIKGYSLEDKRVQVNEQITDLTTGLEDTVYENHDTQSQLMSDTADELLWSQLSKQASSTPVMREALRRVNICEGLPYPSLHELLQIASKETNYAMASFRTMSAVVGRNRRMSNNLQDAELRQIMVEHEKIGAVVRQTLGNVGSTFLAAGVTSGLLIIHAASVPDAHYV